MIFDSIKEAMEKYNICYYDGIIDVCKGKQNFCGKLDDGTPLQWMYYKDYLRKCETNQKIDFIKTNPFETQVICITTGIIFKKMKNAQKFYNLKGSSGIRNSCIKSNYHAGKLPDGTPLKWMYYDDFLKLPIEEQNEILSRNKESSTDGSFLLDKEAM